MKKHYLLLTILGIIALSIQIIFFIPSTTSIALVDKGFKKENINRVGKAYSEHSFKKLYNKSIPLFSPLENEDLLPFPTEKLNEALAHQAKLIDLKRSNTDYQYYSDNQLVITKGKLDTTIQLMQEWTNNENIGLSQLFDTYLIKGKDKKGNVKFTGYFSPIIEVNSERTNEYPHPIYARPDEGLIPTRGEIHAGALVGKGLELAWAKSQKDIRSLQLQGSGYAKYPNGKTEYLAYGGNNGRTRSNSFPVEKVAMSSASSEPDTISTPKRQMRPGYTFFERSRNRKVSGAGSVPLTADISVAVDSRLIPLGACLLVEMPIINEKGRLINHEYRILLAQDTGGAIKGAGRIDYYTGIGKQAEMKARYYSHYGRVWILMPKS